MRSDELARAPGSSRMNVLVFPCGSEIGLEIHRALRFSTHFELIGASSVPSNHGKYVYERYMEGVPCVDQPGWFEALNRVIDKQRVEFVFPAHDSVVLALALRASELRARYVGSPAITCQVCRSKRATYQALGGCVRVPRLFGLDEAPVSYPVFLKPDAGQGSQGTHIAHSREEVDFFLRQDPSLLLMELMPGREYTVDCFTDRFGALRFAGARERIRIMNGISVDTAPVEGEEYQRMAEALNASLRFRGGWFFQAKRATGGELVLLEAAPRVSGSMALYRNLGVNFEALALFDLMDKDVDVRWNHYSIRMDRALNSRFSLDLHYEHVYIDLDDTILRDGQVNPLAAAFLYQCRNRGIRLHLLSRHAGDLRQTLNRLAIEPLFDTIVQVPDCSCKSEYILTRSAIFIDDSFAERRRVQERLGIPTFAADALESLMRL